MNGRLCIQRPGLSLDQLHGRGGKEAEEFLGGRGADGGEEEGHQEWARVDHLAVAGDLEAGGGDHHLCFLSGSGGVGEEEAEIAGGRSDPHGEPETRTSAAA